MANADVKEEVVLQKPTSRAVTTLKKVLNICFYVVSLMWIAYSTFSIVEVFRLNAKNNELNGLLWFVYHGVHSTIVGLITYKALIDLKLKDSHFFIKYHLVAVFVSFGVTAPLAGLPLVILLGPLQKS